MAREEERHEGLLNMVRRLGDAERGPARSGYVVVGEKVRLLGSDPLGDATNNAAEYTAVRNALKAAAWNRVGVRAITRGGTGETA